MKNLWLLLLLIICVVSCGKEESSMESPTASLDTSSSFENFVTTGGGSASAGNSTGGNTVGGVNIDQAGILTAGEWNDIENWFFLQDLLNGEAHSDKLAYWGIYTTNAIKVKITDNVNQPFIDAKVDLIDNGTIRWSAKTDNKGEAVLVPTFFEANRNINLSNLVLSINEGANTLTNVKTITQGVNEIQMTEQKAPNNAAQISFIVDATSSMADELEFLKTELKDVIERAERDNADISIATSTVFYRDKGDEYVTRKSDFSDEALQTLDFINQQSAQGGGDFPEAVHSALNVALRDLQWLPSAKARIMFLLLDAPPHSEEQILDEVRNAIKEAASLGIKIIPVTASGINKETEFLMRFSAIATNGTYVFITDDSGVGNEHLEPTVGDYEVEFLNDLMVRLISENIE